MKKLFLTAALAVAALAVLGGCGPSAKTFAKDGISITANTDFKQTEKEGHALYLESAYASISIKKEAFAELDGLDENSDLRDYTESVIANNQIDADIQNFGGTSGYDYFAYEKKVDNADFSYLAATIKGKDAFYLATFQSKKSDYKNYENIFKDWAKSIKVDNKIDD